MKGNILIVDNDRENQLLISEALKKNGYNCDRSDRLQSALEKLHTKKYDLLLIDKNMPIEGNSSETGMELIRVARLKYPNTIIILMTDHPTVDSASDALKIGAFDCIFKPLDLKLLGQKVDRFCEYRKFINPRTVMDAYLNLNRDIIEAINGETVDINTRLRLFQDHLDYLFKLFHNIEHSLLDHRESLAIIEEYAEQAIDMLPADNPLNKILHNIADKAAQRL